MKQPTTLMGCTVLATCHSLESMTNYAQLATGQIIRQRVGFDWERWKKWPSHVIAEDFATMFDLKIVQPSKGKISLGIIEHPTLKQLEHWEFDGVSEATDGCQVEPDGTCPHGCKSWNLYF